MRKRNIYGKERTVEKYVSRCISRVNSEDREVVREYIDDLDVGVSRTHKVASALSMCSRELGQSFHKLKKKDMKRYCRWLEHETDMKQWTVYDREVILKQFLRWLGKSEEAEVIRPKAPKNGTMSREVLTETEVKDMVVAAYSARDKALVLSLYESGARIGEFLPLKIRHLEFDRHGAVLYIPEGKTGPRRVRLVASTLSLQKWLGEHPRKEPNSYIWCPIPSKNNPKWKNRHIAYDYLRRLLRELAEKAGVEKKVTPHAFRHARATFMARHLKEPEMRQFFGWGNDSDMPSVYVHLSGRDVDSSVLSVYGITEEDSAKPSELQPQECPRCGEGNDPTTKYCAKCGLPFGGGLDGERDRLEAITVKLLKVMAKRDPEIKKEFREIVRQEGAKDLFA